MSDDGDDEEESGGGGWLVSYADLMTLLFAAFVVLYGTMTIGTNPKYLGVLAAIRESFVEVSDLVAVDELEGSVQKGKFVFKAFQGETFDRKDSKTYLIKDNAHAVIDQDKNKVDNLLDQISMNRKKMDYKFRHSMNTEKNERGFTIKLQGAYFFQKNSYRLERKSQERFLALGKMIVNLKRNIVIEGHTDASKSVGKFSNSELGALRAASLSKILITKIGMNPAKIKTISYGSSRPIASNKTKEGRQKNRRVEIKISYE